jgi:hypothetical protein
MTVGDGPPDDAERNNPLPKGGQLLILLEAGEYIQSLPKSVQKTKPWETATEAVNVHYLG